MAKSGKRPTQPITRPLANLRMEDLARMAGVSKSTVSRALADSDLVKAPTKQRIQELARQHNYRLDTAARNFRLKESLGIGVVIPAAPDAHWRISDPFFLELLGGIVDAVNARGHRLLLSKSTAQSADWIEKYVKARTTDGVILLGQGMQHQTIDTLGRMCRPLVAWGTCIDEQQSYSTVGSDNELGGYLATRHLIEQGRRRIAFLGNVSWPEAVLRFAGYRRALAEAGFSLDARWQHHPLPNQRHAAYTATQAWLELHPGFDAIFAFSDVFAVEAIKALRDAGRKVPGDVSVVGYDDLEIAAYFSPGLTTVHQDRRDGGRLLVDTLLSRMEGAPVESVVMDTELVIRESSVVGAS